MLHFFPMRTCKRCGKEKSEGEFYLRDAASGRRRGTCKACDKAREREKYAEDPDYYKVKAARWAAENAERDRQLRRRNKPDQHRRQKYGITPEQYEAMKAEQGGRCAICRDPLAEPESGRRSPHVDHCHRTGANRGILCHGCNTGIGSLRDDPEIVARALAYLRRYAEA